MRPRGFWRMEGITTGADRPPGPPNGGRRRASPDRLRPHTAPGRCSARSVRWVSSGGVATAKGRVRVKIVLPLDDARAALAGGGGRGASLAGMARAGLPVPRGFHVTTQAYRAFVAGFRDE